VRESTASQVYRCHPERSEGSMDFAHGTNLQRSFASLRMTMLVPN
jgi:hypothetical protein